MAHLSTIIDEPSLEARSSERRTSKTRMTLPRNSVVFSNSEGNTGIHSSEDNSTLRPHRRSSRYSFPRGGHDRRPARHENTYQMEPADYDKLDVIRIRRIATSIIETAIIGYKYNGNQAKDFTIALAEHIRSQMKQLSFPRYKIVIQVSVGQKKGQYLRISSQCMWDLKLDRHITITKETVNAYITATIFFVYTE